MRVAHAHLLHLHPCSSLHLFVLRSLRLVLVRLFAVRPCYSFLCASSRSGSFWFVSFRATLIPFQLSALPITLNFSLTPRRRSSSTTPIPLYFVSSDIPTPYSLFLRKRPRQVPPRITDGELHPLTTPALPRLTREHSAAQRVESDVVERRRMDTLTVTRCVFCSFRFVSVISFRIMSFVSFVWFVSLAIPALAPVFVFIPVPVAPSFEFRRVAAAATAATAALSSPLRRTGVGSSPSCSSCPFSYSFLFVYMFSRSFCFRAFVVPRPSLVLVSHL